MARLTQQDKTTRCLIRAFAELSNFPNDKRLEILNDVRTHLTNDGWISITDLVAGQNPMLLRVMRQINEVATGSATQSEAICQIIVWSEKAMRIAESDQNCGPCYRYGKGVVFGCTEHQKEGR